MAVLTPEDKKLLQRCLSDNPQLKAVFDRLVVSLAPVLSRLRESKNGVWVNNSDIQRQVDAILSDFARNMMLHINVQTAWAWELANGKNDALVNAFLKGIRLPAQVKAQYLNRNIEALKAFQKRKIGGIDLSKRVWAIEGQSKTLIETYLENGLATGKSAAEISRDVRQLLNDPTALFRRIRNSKGQLVPSAAMKANRPCTGVYNSAYQNALRLTATETNMAYRTADHERWNQIDFITGFEVITSDVHHTRMPQGDICDSLKGKYPKTFKFTGWHPRCFCQAVACKLSREQFMQYIELKDAGDINGAKDLVDKESIKGVSTKVSRYVKDNSDRFNRWSNKPYWLKDNFSYSKGGYLPKMGLDLPKAKPIKNYIPAEFAKGSKYLKGTDIEFKNEFFAKISPSEPIKLTISKRHKGSYYDPSKKEVVIADGLRNEESKWHRESVVYHEFGHAIDWQKGLRNGDDIPNMMDKWRKELKKRVDPKSGKKIEKMGIAEISDRLTNIARRLFGVDDKYFEKRGITKSDIIEQICGVQDTIMSLNPNYGFGHAKAYFSNPSKKKGEFIAHCFENAYAENRVFEKYLPDLYKEMSDWAKAVKQ